MRVVDNVGFDVKKQDIPGGGSGSGQPLATPDWNQNNETAADYIKNRAFYTTDPVETELVNGTFAFVADNGMYATKDITFDLVEGKTYKVSIDGVEYETACQNYNGVIYIGSIELAIGGNPSYPFLFFVSGGNSIFYTNIEGDSHDVVIKANVAQVVQIPDKYISDTFRNFIYVKNPVIWSKADWDKYYELYQSGKLLKLEAGGNTRGDNGYILSMVYTDTITLASYINQLGEIFTLGQNSTTKKYFWAPIFSYDEFYFKYSQDGSSLSEDDRASYKKIGVSASSLVFTTKETDKAAVKRKVVLEGDKELILSSSTANSTKKFKITVDDSGALTATEITE